MAPEALAFQAATATGASAGLDRSRARRWRQQARRNAVSPARAEIGLTDCLNSATGAPRDHAADRARHRRHARRVPRAAGPRVVSGNVSLYNETDGRAILPTPTVGGRWPSRPADVVRASFPAAGLSRAAARRSARRPARRLRVRRAPHGRGEGPPPRSISTARRGSRGSASRSRARGRSSSGARTTSRRAGCWRSPLGECCRRRRRSRGAGGRAGAAAGRAGRRARAARRGAVRRGAEPDPRERPARGRGRGRAQAKAAGVPCTELGTTGGDRLTIDAGGGEGSTSSSAPCAEARDRCLEPIVGR